MTTMWRSLTILLAVGWCTALSAQAAPDDELRRFFEGLDAGAAPMIEGRTLHRPGLLAGLYRNREHRPVWTSGGPLSHLTRELLTAIDQSTRHGLNGAAYHQEALATLLSETETANPLVLELLASDAFLRQVRHRSTGAVSPQKLDPEWHLLTPEVDAIDVLNQAIAGTQGVRELLDSLWPDNDEYHALVNDRARILALGEVEVATVPSGALLKAGQSGERVVALKERLLGPGDHSPLFDDELLEAVVAFQRSAGLETDGVVGNATLEVMNASRFSWIDRIDANLERWRWLPLQEPDTYIRVNIASFKLRAIHAGEDALIMDVIVGRPYRRTPVFTESIKYIVFNPFWNLPFSIAVRDKLPELKRDPAVLAAQGYEVRPAGQDQFIPVTDHDWSGVERSNFRHHLRQRPGPHNALGQMKFMLPNAHAVYLHDTPGRELFNRQERSFSSGCVRLSRPMELAAWILDNDGRSAEAARVADIVNGPDTTVIYLRRPVPTYLVYFTAFVDESGDVVFRRDLYDRDAAVVSALRDGTSV